MLRQLHSLPGLIAALFVIALTVTGAILSLDPALERAGATVPPTGQISVAELAGRVAEHYPGAEQIERTPSGTLIVYYAQDGQVGADRVDPRTGQAIAAYEPSSFSRWVKNLHRSLLLDTPGRAVAGITALAMMVLAVSGALLLAARLGGWRQLLRPVRGTLSQRLHIELGRAAILGLLLSGLTGTYLSATTFGLASEGMEAEPEFPLEVNGGPPAAIDTLSALKTTDLNDLRIREGGRDGAHRQGLAAAAAARHHRPAVKPGVRPLGQRGGQGTRHRADAGLYSGAATHHCAGTGRAGGLRCRRAGPHRRAALQGT